MKQHPSSPTIARFTAPLRRAAVAFCCALLLGMIATSGADAATRAFSKRFSANVNGDVVLIGNTAMTCNGGCSAQNGSGNDDSYTMVYTNGTGYSITTQSSTATLTATNMPAGSTVLWAGLYWQADSSSASRGTVTLQTPGGTYTVNASQVDTIAGQGCGGNCAADRYSAFADVTNLVMTGGNGDYTVSNIQGSPSNANTFGGWALVVAYQNSAKSLRNLTVFDGYQGVSTSANGNPSPNPDVYIPVSGFLTPYSGPINTTIGVVAGEGDQGITGDSFYLNGTILSDAVHSSNNFFMSAISDMGSYVSAKSPNYSNQLGWDIARVTANNILANGSTSATIHLSTTQDWYYPSAVTFVSDLYVPTVAPNISKTAAKVGSGSLVPGDALRFTVNVGNTGYDSATNVILTDPIPTWTTYKPGTLQIISGANIGAKSDASGDDQATYCDSTTTPSCSQPQVIFRLGTGANATNGGTLVYNAFTSLSFDVTVNQNVPSGTSIINSATVGYNGQTLSTTTFSSSSNQVQAVVLTPPTVAKSFTPSVVNIGAVSAMTVTLTNPANNAGTVSGVSFTDIYPPGLINDTANPNPAITCTSGSTPGTLVGGGAGGTSIGMTGATILQNGYCTVSANVKSNINQSGNYLNSTGSVTTTNAGTATGASAYLSVGLPTISQTISTSPATSPPSIATGGTATATFTLTNQATTALTSVGFTDPLPANLTVVTGSLTASQCGGTVSYNAGTNTVILTGGAIAAQSACTVTVPVTSATAGYYSTTANGVTSAQTAIAGPPSNTATLTVNAPPTITKSFYPPSIIRGQDVSQMTIVVTNPNSANTAGTSTITGVAFTDTYPTSPGNLVNGPNPLSTLTCTAGSSATLTGGTAGGNTIGIGSGTLAPGGSCTVTVYVTTAATATTGNYVNSTGSVTTTNAGSGTAGSGTLNVSNLAPPTVAKSFSPASVPKGQTSTLTIQLTNANASAITGVAFTDTYPAGLVNAAAPGVTNSCGGTVTTAAGGSSLVLSGGTISASSSCTITVLVQGNAAGALFNAIPAVITGNAGIGSQAGATLTVVDPPVIAKLFSPTTISTGASNQTHYSTLTITVTNPATNNTTLTTLTGVAFTDTFPTNLVKNTKGGNPAVSCTSGSSATLASTAGSVSISGGTLAAGGTCTVTAYVSSSTAGTYTNSTGAVTSTNGGTGSAAADILTVGKIGITKSFAASPIPYGSGTTTMTLTLTNGTGSNISDGAFTDTYPAGMTNAAAPAVTNTCGGTVTAPANGTSLALTGGSIASGGTCTITVAVSATTASADNIIPVGAFTGGAGAYSNSDQAEAILTTYEPPGVVERFAPSSIGVNTASVMTITISNPNSIAATGTSFTDSYTGGLVNTATPNATQTCSSGATAGTVTAAANGTSLSLSGATIPANGWCTITVNVTSTTAGSITNQTGAVASTAIGTNASGASANLTVLALPTMTKSFSPNQITTNGASLMTVTLTNPNSTAITGAAFTDTYPSSPAGLVNTATPSATTSCLGGTVTAAPGGTSLILSGATIPSSGSCTVTVNVTSAAANAYTNSTGPLSTTNAGTGASASGTLTVVSLPVPTVAMNFSPSQIIVNGTPNSTTMTVTLTNNSATTSVTGVAFTDSYPAGLVNTAIPGVTSTCGGTATATANGTSLSLSGATIPANGSCTVTVNVTSASAGGYTNTITAVTSTNAGTSGPVSAVLSAVYSMPTATKSFNPTTIGTNGTSRLTITLTNPNAAAVTGVDTTDNYPAGLVNTAAPGGTTTCGGTVTATAGGNSLTLSGATIPASGTCTVSVNVTSTTAGTYANSTGLISSANAVTGIAYGPVSLTVIGTTLVKSFTPASVAAGQPSTMKFVITNNDATTDITGVSFTDTFPTSPGQMVVATIPNLTNTCGGAVYRGGTTTAIAAGDTSLSFTGGTIPHNSSCTITLDVVVPTGGSYTNTTSQVTATNAGPGAAGTANLVASTLPAPTVAKSFAPSAIGIGMPSTLTITLTNNSASAAVTGVTFSDTFPSSPGQMVVASSPNLNNGCGGTVTVSGDGKSFTLSGGTIPLSGNCSVKIDVTATVIGTYSNSTGSVTSTNASAGSTATAVLSVSGVSLDKRFNNVYAATIVATTTATLRFIINNGANNPAQAGIGFTDTLATNLTVVGPPTANSCGASIYRGGTTTPLSAGDTVITVSGGSMSAGVTSCLIDIPVTSSVRGTFQNDSTNISLPSINLNPATITASLVTVLASPTLSKGFNPTLTSLPGNSTITFTITNTEPGNPSIMGLGFTDLLPNNLNVSGTLTSPQCGGTVSYTTNVPTNSSIITFANGTLPGASCTITVPVTSANVASTFTNSYPANISGLTGGINAAGASASLTVTSASASLVKLFTPPTIGIGGSSTLSLTINNASGNPAQSGLNFIDNLPAGLSIVGTPTSTCGGTLTYTGTSITLANGVLAQNAASCAISATVTGSTAGAYTNSSVGGNITSAGNKPDISGTSATLNVVDTTLSEAFMPNAIGAGQTSTLRFTISNGSGDPGQTNLGFTDTLPANLTVSGTPASPQCGGSVSYNAGTNVVTFTGGLLASGTANCTIDVTVTSNNAATYTNSSANGNIGGATGGLNTTGAAAVLYVLSPVVTKTFGTNPVVVNTPTTMTIRLSNSNTTQDITGVSLTDTLPSLPGQMVVAPISNLTNSCGGTSSAGGTAVQLNGATIPHNGSCTVVVDITAPTAGSYVNTIPTVTTANAGSTGPVTAPLTVLAQPTVQLSTTSYNGTGIFNYAMTNLTSASSSITTAVAGTPVNGAAIDVTSTSANVTITETAPAGWPANPTAASCIDNNSATSGNPSPPTTFGSLAGNILTIPSANLKPAAQIVCSFVNSAVATITVTKALAPVADTGTFNLLVGAATVASGVGNGGSGSTSVPANSAVTVSEAGAGGTLLTNYDTTYSCTGGINGTGTSVSITPTPGQMIGCTFTNTRKATITVTNALAPIADTGTFNLLVGATTVASGVGNGGSGSTSAPANSAVTVSEAGAGGTLLTNYDTTYSCTGGINGTGTSVSITPAPGQVIGCTFTNTRKATITVNKTLLPAGDTGRFNLLVGAITVATNVGDTGNGSASVSANMPVLVSEAAYPGTSLSGYTAAYSCTGGITGSGTSVSITPSAGQSLTCTFTNTRNAVNVSGAIYSDVNHNWTLDTGETGTGQTLYIKLAAYNGTTCANPATTYAAADPASGTYTLAAVTAGDYCLILDNNADLLDTTPTYPSGWIGTEKFSGIRTITVGSVALTGQNFGMYNGSRLSGKVFSDTGIGAGTPNDGVQNGSEQGLAGVTVRVTDSSGGTVYDSTVTSSNTGNYALWIPAAAGNNPLKVVETNLSGSVSTGGNAGTTGGSYDRTADTVTFTNTVGSSYTGVSFADVPGNTFVAGNNRSVVPGGVVFYPHTFTAGSSGTVTFSTSAVASPAIPGWSEVVFLDSNCNGSIDTGELQIAGPLAASAGQTICILVKEFAPANAPVSATNTVTATASFNYSNASPALATTSTLTDLTTVMRSGLTLSKNVDKSAALPGDTLTYTITYLNSGLTELTNIVISDNFPSYTNSPSACCVNPLSACLGTPPANYPASITGCTIVTTPSAISWTLSGTLEPGTSGQVKFSVKINQ